MNEKSKNSRLARSHRKYLIVSSIPWVTSIGLIVFYILTMGSDPAESLIIRVPGLGLLLGLFAASSRDFFRRVKYCLSYRYRSNETLS